MSTELSPLALAASIETEAAHQRQQTAIFYRVIREAEKGIVVKMLELTGGSISATATALQLNRLTLSQKIDTHNLRHLCTPTGTQNARHYATKRAIRQGESA